jgi:methionyl aminopeptidase
MPLFPDPVPSIAVSIESPRDLAGLQAAGRAVAATLKEVRRLVRPGVTTAELDHAAARVLARHGARSAPRLAYRFPGTICISVDDEAVHGIPGPRRLRAGQLVKLDVTAELDGYYADAAISVPVGQTRPAVGRLVSTATAALREGLGAARAGRPISAIGGAVEAEVERRGCHVLRELTGHGIGRAIHEPPTVPNHPDPAATAPLTEGLVIAVEPMIALGTNDVHLLDDGWTVATDDGSTAAHVEHTIVITSGAPLVVTV